MGKNNTDNKSGSAAIVVADAPKTRGPVGMTADGLVTVTAMGSTHAITREDSSRAAASSLRREIALIVKAQRYAAAVSDGLCTLSEVESVPAKRLDVMIQLRANGIDPEGL